MWNFHENCIKNKKTELNGIKAKKYLAGKNKKMAQKSKLK